MTRTLIVAMAALAATAAFALTPELVGPGFTITLTKGGKYQFYWTPHESSMLGNVTAS